MIFLFKRADMKKRPLKWTAKAAAHGGAIFFLIGFWLLWATGSCAAQEQEKQKAAIAGAKEWLGLVDQGKYAESWTQAAAYFKNAVTPEKWQQSLDAVRKPLGELVSREVKDAVNVTSLPGAPDGEYVVIHFQTSFANKRSAIETVTPMLEKDGKWRVSGYFIK